MTSDDRDDYESWCLGSCFIQPSVAASMRPEIFSNRGRRILEAAQSGIAADGIADVGLAANHIRAHSNGTVSQDLQYLADSLRDTPRSANVGWYVAQLEADYRKNEAALAARAAASAIEDDETPGAVLEHLDAAREALTSRIDDLPEPIDVSAVMAGDQVEPVPWAVSGLFAQQDIVVIGGEGGTGKSILALDLSIALASGQPFLDMLIGEPQPVLYLDEENPPHIVRRRIRQHLAGRCLGPPEGFTYMNQRGLSYHTPVSRARVGRLIDLYRPRWVVLDSYVRFRGGDENSNTDAAEFAAALKAERCRSAIGWIILTHLAKPSKDRPDAVHRIRGASDIVNSSDALLTLEGDRNTERRTLTPQQRRTSTLAPLGISWRESEDEQSARLLSLGSDTKSAEDAVKRSLRLAERSGVLRQDLQAIVDQCGYGEPGRAISRVLGKLTASGSIVTHREGRLVRVWLSEYEPQNRIA